MSFVSVHWIYQVQVKNSWQVIVNTVIKPQVPEKTGNVLTDWSYYYLLHEDSSPFSEKLAWQNV